MSHTVEEHQQMMETPDRWPRWPQLPVIATADHYKESRLIQNQTCGILYADGTPTVYLLNVFEKGEWKTWEERLKDVPRIQYGSFKEIADNWRVD